MSNERAYTVAQRVNKYGKLGSMAAVIDAAYADDMAELARLRGLAAKLPHYADDDLVRPGEAFVPGVHECWVLTPMTTGELKAARSQPHWNRMQWVDPVDGERAFYSSRESAEAAMERENANAE